ncbi:MAG: hypothetical protein CMF74_08390 [Maricaulis sp.]|jgi:uncharacterized protein (DUF2336 family)|nr:hypothetical protein [Maricaulis sp.]HAQ35585.1 hypothetical protein [Alphaproteobacteria bacterium]
MAVISRLNNLVDLAREKSSDRRRDLLREVADLFFEEPPVEGSGEQSEFDTVLSRLAAQTATEARAELSRRFADAPLAPRNLVMQLARDAIEVAAPILQKSNALNENDLVALAEELGQDHLNQMSVRETVPERVSAAIVRRGDDRTVARLISNEGARLSRQTYEEVTERAETNAELAAPLIQRKETPVDLLNDLVAVVETQLRERILKRFESVDPEVLEEAMQASHNRLEARMAADAEIQEATRYINSMKVRKQFDGALLAKLMRERQFAKLAVGLADMSGLDYRSARMAIEHESVDPLCLICKAGGLDRSLFVTMAVLRNAGRTADALRDAKEYGQIFDSITDRDAQRAMRFMMLRRDAA